MKAKIQVMLKEGVLDPQGKAIQRALDGLGFNDVRELRLGKIIELVIDENNTDEAHAQISAMCEQLLANTVIENYHIELSE
ncbi:MAG: phosphoribosylformylglycinamidine synthase [Rhodospirillaceae bacterium]|nr:phosphoribosylformylglycinamidine synthase [Rhodospirillaceae bacterium]|tara:strand:+ start:4254 stop:4496 length:243 start_codon:yes stop_codon:yes gene_type:complete